MSDKKLWEVYPTIWKTESAFMSWVRGGIRQGLWNRHPVKLEFIKQNKIPIKNPNPRGKKAEVQGAQCCQCGNHFVISEMEVDHKEGGHSLKTFDDLPSFLMNIVLVTLDDLQFICKGCHKIKSHSDRKGVSFEEAEAEKKAIALEKKGVAFTKKWLIDKGVTPSGKKEERRQQVIDLFRRGEVF